MRVAHYLSTVSESEIMKSSGDQSDLSKVFEQNDIFTFWLAILGIIRVKNIGRFTLTFCR